MDAKIIAEEIPVIEVGLVPTLGPWSIDANIRTEMVSGALFKASIAKGKGEARRLIVGGGVSVNNVKINQDMIISQPSLIKKGKNSFVLVR